jgi:hypothetical protein
MIAHVASIKLSSCFACLSLKMKWCFWSCCCFSSGGQTTSRVPARRLQGVGLQLMAKAHKKILEIAFVEQDHPMSPATTRLISFR